MGAGWLIASSDDYSFEELGRLRTLRDLRATRISSRSIRRSLDAMQRVAGVRNPLMEASAIRRGSRLIFRYGGALLDPVTQQLAFDFAVTPERQLQVVRTNALSSERHALQLQEMFQRAVQLEEKPTTIPQAMEMYEAILQTRPTHAPALINLGTIYYNQREFEHAEQHYRRATVADPDYALAFFDLGNVLDEMQRLNEATAAYERAVALVPQYADAHYNLALAYERQGQRRAGASALADVRAAGSRRTVVESREGPGEEDSQRGEVVDCQPTWDGWYGRQGNEGSLRYRKNISDWLNHFVLWGARRSYTGDEGYRSG